MTAKLFGMPGSLYTARARSYLIKQRIDFEEAIPADPAWPAITQAIGRWIIPVLVLPDGRMIQDGVAIIDHYEAQGVRRSAYPETPVHRAVAHLFELYGAEGMLRPAMHYRWSFDADNLAFLRRDFMNGLMPAATGDAEEAIFLGASGRMRKAAASFGVSEATAPAIEASYLAFLGLLDAHLADYPYLLGGRPTIGDYGLIGPLYAHLARDPVPAAIMKSDFFHVWRWTERMNAAQALLGGHAARGEALIDDDGVPETLKALMRFVADDFLPELAAHVAFANDWLAERPDLVAGTNGLDNPGARGIGMAGFEWQGHALSTAVLPYRFWMLDRLLAAVGDSARSLFGDVGLAPLLALRTDRPVERQGNLEVWGARR
ncbi:MAG: glutathione S-transferase C-terminal domain-containing protein [Sphingomonas sp.]|uniref:glutathione S-transferase N-terminal domain-containing protein n=1 Tax=Sphingomonas sp. TaxID=28214 RepID=UPI0025F476D7|nr:glutathione S-transferase N-terminal domain-containing protein [Sphingomonas sp.]MBY0284474.1 glutathione S-transferase C-terminal domain-containing protein [Sphingomonas sp.]